MEHRPEIDGLRAIAVVPVLLFHAGLPGFSGGYVGVDVFFVISGFLITSLLIAEHQKTGRISIRRFYERRIRRLLPALFVLMLACLAVGAWVLLPSDLSALGRSVIAVTAFVSNLLFWRESGYFDSAAELKPLLHTWSLALEEQFYVLYPLLILGLLSKKPRLLRGALLVLCIGSFGLCIWGSYNVPSATFYLLPTRGWELLIGALAATQLRVREGWLASLGAMGGLALIGAAVFGLDRQTVFPGAVALVPTSGTALVLMCASRSNLGGRLLSSRPLVLVGAASYSIYLWHQPILAFARHLDLKHSFGLALGLSVLAVALGGLSWRFVEQPTRSGLALSGNAAFKFAAVGSVLLACVGLVLSVTRGLELRYDAADRELAGLDSREAGKYVEARFKRLVLNSFAAGDPRKKILIVGDSFGEDLVNALFENQLDRRIQVSTFHSSVQCGNLYVAEDLSPFIAPTELRACRRVGWFEDPALQALLVEADEVWLVSCWTRWQAQRVAASLNRLEARWGSKFRVFGTKSFGEFSMRELLAIPQASRGLVRKGMSREAVEINGLLRESVPVDRFVDVAALLCEQDSTCPVFTNEGGLISHDGAHLTRAGAAFLGARLRHAAGLQGLLGGAE